MKSIPPPSGELEALYLRVKQSLGTIQFASKEVDTGHGKVRVALGYRRSQDFDKTDGPGQDDAALRVDSDFIVGVLADGVGQSFFGHLAAAKIVDFLIEHLWQHRRSPPSAETLESMLGVLSTSVNPEIQGQALSPNLPSLQRQALDLQRTKGSQAVFSAFVCELASSAARIYSVGDTRVLLFREGSSEPESIVAEKQGRWSSSGQSRLLLKVVDANPVSAVVLKSDGAAEDWGHGFQNGWPDQNGFASMLEVNGHEDDVSFVAFSFRRPAMPAAAGTTTLKSTGSSANEAEEDGAAGSVEVNVAPGAARGEPSRLSVVGVGGVLAGYAAGILSVALASRIPAIRPLFAYVFADPETDGILPPQRGLPIDAHPREETIDVGQGSVEADTATHVWSPDKIPERVAEQPDDEGSEGSAAALVPIKNHPRTVRIDFQRWKQTEFNSWFEETYGAEMEKPWTGPGGLIVQVECPSDDVLPPISLLRAGGRESLVLQCDVPGAIQYVKYNGTKSEKPGTWRVAKSAVSPVSDFELQPDSVTLTPREDKKNDAFLGYYRAKLTIADQGPDR